MSKIKRVVLYCGFGVVLSNGIVLTLVCGLLSVKQFINEGSVFAFFIMVILLGTSVAVVTVAPRFNKHFKTILDFLVEN